MPNTPTLPQLPEDAELLRIHFLDRELDLAETLIDLARSELNQGNRQRAIQLFRRADEGLVTVRRLLRVLAWTDHQLRLTERLEQIADSAATMRAALNTRKA